jgi:sugar/nucleoside kinase (ribokinase family)
MPPQFLVVGHVVQDLNSPAGRDAWRLGGTAAYASLLAHRLGLRAAVLTAASDDLALEDLLPDVECRVAASPCTTQIRNVYAAGQRQQWVPQRAADITPGQLPEDWRQTPIVLLGPVAGEVDDRLAQCFPNSLLGVSAQGWLREIGADTMVRPLPAARWRAAPLLGPARALFVSQEDVSSAEKTAALQEWSLLVESTLFTRGEIGAEVCMSGRWRHIDAFPAAALDPTGAGDVFAAAFLIHLWKTGDGWESARFAACASSLVVEGEGTTTIPDRDQIEARLRQYPQIGAR